MIFVVNNKFAIGGMIHKTTFALFPVCYMCEKEEYTALYIGIFKFYLYIAVF